MHKKMESGYVCLLNSELSPHQNCSLT